MKSYPAFGTLLKQQRKKKKLTSAQLADLLHKSERTISSLENGSISTVETLIKLCNILEISPDYLLGIYIDQDIESEDNQILFLYESVLKLKPSERKMVQEFIQALLQNRKRYAYNKYCK